MKGLIASLTSRVPVGNLTLPGWIFQLVLGALLTGSIAWATHVTNSISAHTTKIAVVETKEARTEKDIDEIKSMITRIDDYVRTKEKK